MALSGTLVTLDFDHTVIGVNSDTYVVEKLSNDVKAALGRLDEYGERGQWTAGMDNAMGELHAQGMTIDQIKECMETIKIDPKIKTSIEGLASRGASVRILSDANTLFIEWIVAANGLAKSIDKVLSNPAEIDKEGRMRVHPYHKDAHPAGSSSPANLCKGRVMKEWLAEKAWTRVVYAGDGGGDYEGTMRVPAGGCILARHEWPLHKKLLKGGGAAAKLETWGDQAALGEALGRELL